MGRGGKKKATVAAAATTVATVPTAAATTVVAATGAAATGAALLLPILGLVQAAQAGGSLPALLLEREEGRALQQHIYLSCELFPGISPAISALTLNEQQVTAILAEVSYALLSPTRYKT